MPSFDVFVIYLWVVKFLSISPYPSALWLLRAYIMQYGPAPTSGHCTSSIPVRCQWPSKPEHLERQG